MALVTTNVIKLGNHKGLLFKKAVNSQPFGHLPFRCLLVSIDISVWCLSQLVGVGGRMGAVEDITWMCSCTLTCGRRWEVFKSDIQIQFAPSKTDVFRLEALVVTASLRSELIQRLWLQSWLGEMECFFGWSSIFHQTTDIFVPHLRDFTAIKKQNYSKSGKN